MLGYDRNSELPLDSVSSATTGSKSEHSKMKCIQFKCTDLQMCTCQNQDRRKRPLCKCLEHREYYEDTG